MTNTEMQLRNIITAIRAALGTPDNVDVTHHAAQVVAEAQRARADLAQARTMLQQAHDELQVANKKIVARDAWVARRDEMIAERDKAAAHNFDEFVAAQADAAMVEADLRTANEMLQESRTEAVCAAVPWNTLYSVVYGMGDDCMEDLRQWFMMHAPQEVRG